MPFVGLSVGPLVFSPLPPGLYTLSSNHLLYVFSWNYCAPMLQCLPSLSPPSLLMELTLTTDSWLCWIFRVSGMSSCDLLNSGSSKFPQGGSPWDRVWQIFHYREHLWSRTQLLCSIIYGCISAMATPLTDHVQSTMSVGRRRQTYKGSYRTLQILALPHWLCCVAGLFLDSTAVQETLTPLLSLSPSRRVRSESWSDCYSNFSTSSQWSLWNTSPKKFFTCLILS